MADAQSVYWLADGIWSAPRAGGTATRIYDTGGDAAAPSRVAGALAVHGSALYAALPDAGTVLTMGLDGSGATALSTGEANPTRVVSSGSAVYWLDLGTPGIDCTPDDGSLRAWSGGSASTLVQGIGGGADLAIAGGAVLFTADGRYCNVPGLVGSVTEVTLATSAQTALAAQQLGPQTVVTDGVDVYWTVVSDWDLSGAIVHSTLR